MRSIFTRVNVKNVFICGMKKLDIDIYIFYCKLDDREIRCRFQG